MEACEIKLLLKTNNIKIIDIAASLNCSHVSVSHVIHRHRVSARIRLAIAKAINKPVEEVFPA